MNFGESLTSLMIERNLDSKTLASNLSVSRNSVNNWKSNRTDIRLPHLIELCRYFNCSLDYLVGRTVQEAKPRNFELSNFGKQIRKVMKSRNISTYTLQKDTRFYGKFFHDWDRGSYPQLSTLIELANYLNCSLDELVGLE